MKKIDTYISRAILGSTGMVALVLVVLVMVSRFIGETDSVGQGGYGWLEMLAYVVLKTPADILLVMPVITLLGALMALGALAGGRELIVLRSAGVSMWRLVGSVSVAGVILALIAVGIGEYLGPHSTDTAEQLRYTARHGTQAQSLPNGVWLRQDNAIVRVGGTLPGKRITDVTIYRLDKKGRLQTTLHAHRAMLDKQGMVLIKPQITRVSINGTQTPSPKRLRVNITLGTNVLKLATVDPAEQSSLELWRYINYLQANNVDASDYQLALWRNIVMPFTVWLLVVFALPFALGSLRGAGAGQRLFLGGLLGLVFYLVNEIVAASGMVYGLPPWLAASLPTLVLGAGTIYWIRRLN